ncbi:hypothetical protein BC937DRAFT_86717 [Endogone sp. FLAS-F59071]|nr:hypothetical protein BC937DRAFT_86717 [Endogone sp. FLAS-F59071]|eukprot:RUS19908.1 hypothetical protein BC937DRAFT_86717 [Endogone sp. FLAS-F59071]
MRFLGGVPQTVQTATAQAAQPMQTAQRRKLCKQETRNLHFSYPAMFNFRIQGPAPTNSTSTGSNLSRSSSTRSSSGSLFRTTSNDSSNVSEPKPANLGKRPSLAGLSTFASRSSTSSSTTSTIPIPANSWGMLALSRLRDDGQELEDILELLLSKKALLLLPVSQPSLPSAIIDREFIEDHVVVYQNAQDTTQVISLSGIRGFFEKDRFVALGLLPSERELTQLLFETTASKKSIFDAFTLDTSSVTSDYVSINILASHVEIALNNSTITVMLVQRPVSRKDVIDWMATKQEQRAEEQETEKEDAMVIPEGTSAKLMETLQNFIIGFRKKPPRTPDLCSDYIQDFLEDVRMALESFYTDDVQMTEEEVDEKMEWVERYICGELYDSLFAMPQCDDHLHDEALGTRIAALNLLDLELGHLGVIVDDPDEIVQINEVVRLSGVELQKMNGLKGPGEKLAILVNCHRIVVDAIEKFTEKYKDKPYEAPLIIPTVSPETQQINIAASIIDEIKEGDNALTPPPVTEKKPMTTEAEQVPEDTDIPFTTGDRMPVTVTDAVPPIMLSRPAPPTERLARDDDQQIRSTGADVLLPLLIFSVVKSNPSKFTSNLKYIQRFRMRYMLTGEASYCLTNLLAAVSFLETTNLIGLGLSAEKVISDVTDLQSTVTTSTIAFESLRPVSIANQARKLSVGPDIVDVASDIAGGGLKVISGVVDSSYKMLGGLGSRFWGGSDLSLNSTGSGVASSASSVASASGTTTLVVPGLAVMEEVKNAVVSRVAGATAAIGGELEKQKELKDMGSGTGPGGNGSESVGFVGMPNFIESRASSQRSNSTTRSEAMLSLSAPSTATAAASVATTIYRHDPPVQRFLDAKVEDLRLGEVAELLADYKRLAALIKQTGLC